MVDFYDWMDLMDEIDEMLDDMDKQYKQTKRLLYDIQELEYDTDNYFARNNWGWYFDVE